MNIYINEIDDFLFEKAYKILEDNRNWMKFSYFKEEMIRKCMTSKGCTRKVIHNWIEGCLDVAYITKCGDMVRGEWIGLDKD